MTVVNKSIGACKHCEQGIYFCELAEKWFHDANHMTFCFGMAFRQTPDGRRTESPQAEPA